MNKLPVKELLQEAVAAIKSNPKLLLGVAALNGLIISLARLPAQLGLVQANLLILLLIVLLKTWLGIGQTLTYLGSIDHSEVSINTLFSGGKNLIHMLIGGIRYGLAVGVGFLLLVIPGIIYALKYFLYGFLIVDKGLTSGKALKESARLTNGYKSNLFALLIGLALIANLGALSSLGIGALLKHALSPGSTLRFLCLLNNFVFTILGYLIGAVTLMASLIAYRRILGAQNQTASVNLP